MKKSAIFLFLILFLVVLAGNGGEEIVSRAETLVTDTIPPVLNQVLVSPTTVTVNTQFTVKVFASDDSSGIESVALKIEGPSGSETNQIVSNITSVDSTGNWSANLLMPATAENGTWRVGEVVLVDNNGNSKTYVYGTDISAVFTVTGNTATNCTDRPILNEQNQNNCLWSNGSWNSLTCTCTCPTNWYLGGGGSCVYMTTPTETETCTDSGSDCTTSGGSWNSTTCTCTCPTNYTLSGSSCVADTDTTDTTLETNCSSSSALNTQNQNNCLWSNGSWNSLTCTCTCPTNYYLGGGGSCVYAVPGSCSSSASASDCTTSGGSWNSTTCTCTCPTNYTLSGTKCVINTTCASGSASDCTTSGGSWNSLTCTCTCPTNYTLSGSSCVADTVVNNCTSSTVLNNQNKNNCVWSKGSWNSLTCTCTCPTNYYLGGGGSCVYKTETCTDSGSACTTSGGSWNSTTCTCTCPTNYTLSGTKCASACTKDEWKCDDWSVCVNGKQYRPCTLVYDCPGVSEVSPRTEQSCTAETETEQTPSVSCYYKFSDYGTCINGKQTRKVLSSYPEGCIDKLTEPLERACTSIACSYKYSQWSECKDGKRTRDIISTYPEGCVPGDPIVEEACKLSCTDSDWKCDDWSVCGSEGTQYRKCSLSENCISSSTLKSPQTTRSCVYVSSLVSQTEVETAETQTETEAEKLPEECVRIGWMDKSDCQLYLYQSRIVSDCREKGLTSQSQCREYLLSKYGKPLKCQNLSEESCNSLINNVILSDLKTVITSEVKEKLTEVAGNAAVVDIQNQTIKVEVTASPAGGQSQPVTEVKEVRVENLPIVSAVPQTVSVSLISAETETEQENLSPVAIAFDADGDGLPDDVEKRLGTDIDNKDTDSDGYTDAEEVRLGTDPLDPLTKKIKTELAGVDKALVQGKTLEQPKYSVSTVSTSLAVEKVETVKIAETEVLRFEGTAQPNQVVTLFIYSTMPIVVTVQADANGNWTYDLDKAMVDGTHEVYVAVNNDEGKIVESGLPTPFFIAEAQAVSVDDFVAAAGDATQIESQANNMLMLYVLSGLAVILVLIAAFLIIKQRFAE